MNETKLERSVWVAMVVVALLLAALAIGVYDELNGEDKEKAHLQLFSQLVRFVLVGMIGGLAAMWHKRLERRRSETSRELASREQKQDELRTRRREFRDRVGTAYRDVKHARRRLTAAGLTTKGRDEAATLTQAMIDSYAKEIEPLNQAQLQLEGLKIEARAEPEIGGRELAKQLETMERYVRRITGEYEEKAVGLEAGTPATRLPFLFAFTGPHDERVRIERTAGEPPVEIRSLRHDFADPHHQLIHVLAREPLTW